MDTLKQFGTLEELETFFDDLEKKSLQPHEVMSIFKKVKPDSRKILAPLKVLEELEGQELIDWALKHFPKNAPCVCSYEVPQVLMSHEMSRSHIQRMVDAAYKNGLVITKGWNDEYCVNYFPEPYDEENELEHSLMGFLKQSFQIIPINLS